MMRKIISFLIMVPLLCLSQSNKNFAIVIHGGAGIILKENISAELEKAYKDKLSEALQAGYDTLNKGGSSIGAW
jgi:beta-aspartyl-peptidase (threonine type)